MGDQDDDELDDLLENGAPPILNRLAFQISVRDSVRRWSLGNCSLGWDQPAREAIFRRRLRPEDGHSCYFVVQNTGRWAPSGSLQDYAVAVALEHSDEKIDLYAEVAIELRNPDRATR